jgi:Zn-dependent protease
MAVDPKELTDGLIQFVIFLFSTTCHEASHALAAKKGGDLTAFKTGQVTLNPLPHIRREPIGMVLMPLICFAAGGLMIGWASTPYDPLWARRYPRRAALMSLAGPMANFSLMLLAAALLNLGSVTGQFRDPAPGGVEFLLRILFSLNLLLGIFNLIPIPPLDGFSVLALFLPESAALRLFDLGMQIRSFSFLLLLLGWQYFGVVLNPLRALAVHYLLPLYR